MTTAAVGSSRLNAAGRWLWAAGVLALDQASKWLVRQSFEPGASLPVLSPLFHLTYVQNTGAAFGMLRGHAPLFVALSLAVAGWIVWELRRPRGHTRLTVACLSLIFGGALGNVIDRVRLGYVVDFLDFRVWPVFNVADSAITIGVTLLLWQSFFGKWRG